MTEPTELEKKIAEVMAGIQHSYIEWVLPEHVQVREEFLALQRIHSELVERRLRIEYLGQSSITGGREERIE